MITKTWDDFEQAAQTLVDEIRIAPDVIITPARGGLCLAARLAYLLDVRRISVVNVATYDNNVRVSNVEVSPADETVLRSAKGRVMVVDDIYDTGQTMRAIKRELTDANIIQTVTWFTKSAVGVDLWAELADDWIEFPWERQ